MKLIKNKYTWIFLIFIFFCIAVFAIISKKAMQGYLVLANVNNLLCSSNDLCEQVGNDEILNSNQNYQVYVNNEQMGEYKLDYINKWNFFDKEGKWQNFEDDFIASSSSVQLVSKAIELRQMNEEELKVVNNFLQKNQITKYSELAQNDVLEYDFDKDGKTEKIIIASNVTDESEDEKLFTIIVSIVKNKKNLLFLDINNQYENYSAPAYNIKNILNMFNQKKDLLLIYKGYFSEVGESSSIILTLDGKKFRNIVE